MGWPDLKIAPGRVNMFEAVIDLSARPQGAAARLATAMESAPGRWRQT